MSRKKREHIAPDLTALIDVVFILLIFFLIFTVFRNEQQALTLKLPVAENSQGSSPTQQKLVSVEITNESYAINGVTVTKEELPKQFSLLAKDSILTVRADEKTYYQRLVLVLDLIQKYQLQNVSLITEKIAP
jgi:biopolymer transport protein ExbD